MPMSWTGSTRPPEDPYKTNLTLTNLEAVWANLRAADAPRLVLTMVAVSLDEELAYVRAAIPEARVGAVRLRASEGDLLGRVREREAGSGYGARPRAPSSRPGAWPSRPRGTGSSWRLPDGPWSRWRGRCSRAGWAPS